MSPDQSTFDEYIARLSPRLDGEVFARAPMKQHTTFKIGGMASAMVWPRDLEGVEIAVDLARSMGLTWRVLGEGSNLLVGDGGINEVIVNLGRAFLEIETEGVEQLDEGAEARVTLGAGVKLIKAVKELQVAGLAGMEWAAGIPGSVGGSVVMNAGSMGVDISGAVEWVRWYRPGEGVEEKGKDELSFSYRRLARPEGAVVLASGLKLNRDDPRAVRERIVKGLKRRRQNQPLSYPSAGSVFKNPPGDYSGRLIEEAGLKGKRIGDAQISEKHANFIVNRGRARSRDVRMLIDLAREEVARANQVELELEIEMIGEELP